MVGCLPPRNSFLKEAAQVMAGAALGRLGQPYLPATLPATILDDEVKTDALLLGSSNDVLWEHLLAPRSANSLATAEKARLERDKSGAFKKPLHLLGLASVFG